MSKFKVGDRVRVVRKVVQENGWANSWVDSMNSSIGSAYTIKKISHQNGVYLNRQDPDGWEYGFPPSSLELVKSKSNVKYQYLRGDYFGSRFGDICLTISTEISPFNNGFVVDWVISFKNPKDQFNKVIARSIVDNIPKEQLYIDKQYTRNEIVLKILCHIMYNGTALSKEYKSFVLYLLYYYSQSKLQCN